jgi:hypothetical protein
MQRSHSGDGRRGTALTYPVGVDLGRTNPFMLEPARA